MRQKIDDTNWLTNSDPIEIAARARVAWSRKSALRFSSVCPRS